jgi:glyoxylase-like metal-dependent hydrolase (beta-lactamase superfamily II)
MFPRKINDNLWILGNDYFHIYLIEGKSARALMETGISATAEIVLQQISALGVRPDYLIVSHPHSDHITGLDYLKNAFPQATVIAGEGAESFVSHPKAAPSMIAEDAFMLNVLTERGVAQSAKTIESPPSLGGCRVARDGDELDLGDLKIRFLEAKGHSPGNILIQMPALGTVLVSDSLGNRYPGRGLFPVFFTGYDDFMKTIDRIEKLNPAMIGLAHHGFFTDRNEIRDIFQEARKCMEDVRGYVLGSSREDETIAKELFGFYYTDELAVFLPKNILNCCRLLVRRARELQTS